MINKDHSAIKTITEGKQGILYVQHLYGPVIGQYEVDPNLYFKLQLDTENGGRHLGCRATLCLYLRRFHRKFSLNDIKYKIKCLFQVIHACSFIRSIICLEYMQTRAVYPCLYMNNIYVCTCLCMNNKGNRHIFSRILRNN